MSKLALFKQLWWDSVFPRKPSPSSIHYVQGSQDSSPFLMVIFLTILKMLVVGVVKIHALWLVATWHWAHIFGYVEAMKSWQLYGNILGFEPSGSSHEPNRLEIYNTQRNCPSITCLFQLLLKMLPLCVVYLPILYIITPGSSTRLHWLCAFL